MKTHLLIFSAAILLASCGGTKQATAPSQIEKESSEVLPQKGPGPVSLSQSNFYYSGLFSFKNNALFFYNCLDGQTYPISKKGIYTTVIGKYEELDSTKTKHLYSEIRGYLNNQNGKKQLVVSNISLFSKNDECPPNSIIVGVYATQTAKFKVNINLMVNHNFIANAYDLTINQDEQRTTGTWEMLNENTISLMFESENDYFTHTLNFDNESGEISLDSKKLHKISLSREIEPLDL